MLSQGFNVLVSASSSQVFAAVSNDLSLFEGHLHTYVTPEVRDQRLVATPMGLKYVAISSLVASSERRAKTCPRVVHPVDAESDGLPDLGSIHGAAQVRFLGRVTSDSEVPGRDYSGVLPPWWFHIPTTIPFRSAYRVVGGERKRGVKYNTTAEGPVALIPGLGAFVRILLT